MSKTFEISICSSASSSLQHPNSISNSIISATTNCKYLGITFDSKLFFPSHIDSVVERLGKQSGIVCTLRHYVPRKHLINYYKSNINPIVQYGVWFCTSRTKLNPIFTLQKKILKFIFYRTKHDHCEDLFVFNEILTVYELHVCYELLKFVLRSLTESHEKALLNDFLCYETLNRSTRASAQNLSEVTSPKSKKIKQSIKASEC